MSAALAELERAYSERGLALRDTRGHAVPNFHAKEAARKQLLHAHLRAAAGKPLEPADKAVLTISRIPAWWRLLLAGIGILGVCAATFIAAIAKTDLEVAISAVPLMVGIYAFIRAAVSP